MLQGVLVQKMMMEPYALSPAFFNQRMKNIDLETSTAIFEELKAAGVIRDDDQSHFGLFETWYVSGLPNTIACQVKLSVVAVQSL